MVEKCGFTELVLYARHNCRLTATYHSSGVLLREIVMHHKFMQLQACSTDELQTLAVFAVPLALVKLSAVCQCAL